MGMEAEEFKIYFYKRLKIPYNTALFFGEA